jgi:hypothetical protein
MLKLILRRLFLQGGVGPPEIGFVCFEGRVFVLGAKLESFLVIGAGFFPIAGVFVGFGQAVIDVGGIGVLLRVVF